MSTRKNSAGSKGEYRNRKTTGTRRRISTGDAAPVPMQAIPSQEPPIDPGKRLYSAIHSRPYRPAISVSEAPIEVYIDQVTGTKIAINGQRRMEPPVFDLPMERPSWLELYLPWEETPTSEKQVQCRRNIFSLEIDLGLSDRNSFRDLPGSGGIDHVPTVLQRSISWEEKTILLVGLVIFWLCMILAISLSF